MVAAIVVSDMNERLSPNIAPPITDATQSCILRSAPVATFIATGTITDIVPQDVPIAIEMTQAITNIPTTAKPDGIIDSSRFASKGKNTPFEGKHVYGKVLYTLVNGRVVYSDHNGTEILIEREVPKL